MQPNRTIKPSALKFADSLLGQHQCSLAGWDLAQSVRRKYAVLARDKSEHPPLLDRSPTWEWRASGGIRQHVVDRQPERTRGEMMLPSGETVRPMIARSEKMIQRRVFSDTPPARGEFSAVEPVSAQAAAERGAWTPQTRSSPGLSLAGRFSESASRVGEPWAAVSTASGAGVASFQSRIGRPAVTNTGDTRSAASPCGASVATAAKNDKSPPRLLRFQRTATGIANGRRKDMPAGEPGSALSLTLASKPISKRLLSQREFPRSASSFTKPSIVFSRKPASTLMSFAGYHPAKTGLQQAWAPEIRRAEFFWRDIRINPMGGVANLAFEEKGAHPMLNPGSVTADLTLQVTEAPARSEPAISPIDSPPRLLPMNEPAAVESKDTETPRAAGAKVLNVPEVAERVYRLLERRLVVERERRGVYRT